jgi:hypothetical protein
VEFAARENIIRFERLLGTQTDADERAWILRLLAKERRTLSYIICQLESNADGQTDCTTFHRIFDDLAVPQGVRLKAAWMQRSKALSSWRVVIVAMRSYLQVIACTLLRTGPYQRVFGRY